MIHEKTFTLETGRSVKVIAKAQITADKTKVKPEIEVLIKEPRDEDFRPPIGITHPKYWKLKKLDSRQSKTLQIQYSGITDKQLRKAIREFERLLTPSHLN